jgi:uncharacterized Ntn-hydrolase superfamily protein
VTYSIIALDRTSGQLGVAVQTYWFGVGSIVPWIEPGVGAIATQSFVEPSYGPKGLDLMRAGADADDALRELLAVDEGREARQVAFVDARGNVAAHSGSGCVVAFGNVAGDAVSCQANMMEKDTVWDAMLAAYSSTTGDLAGRMMAALKAAEAEGGDMRGRQSAAMLIAPGEGEPWDRSIDIRVDDSEMPIEELERLLHLDRAWRALGDAGDRAEKEDFEGAMKLYETALEMEPDDPQIAFWAANFFSMFGDEGRSKKLYEQARSREPRWAEYLRRIADVGLYPNDPERMDALFPLEK